MDMFEYVIVIASIIIGLTITHLLQGVARLIQHPSKQRLWWVHLLWTTYMFLWALFWWWFEFRLRFITAWTFELYVLVLSSPVILYLISALLFPRSLEGYEGFKDYFLSRRRWFFGLLIGLGFIDLADTAIKGPDYFHSLGAEYPIAHSVLTALAVVGFFTRRERVQALISLVFLGYQLSWVLRVYQRVG